MLGITNAIYSITVKFLTELKREYGTFSFCLKFQEHTDELMKLLSSVFKIEYIKQNKSQIREAIVDFFSPLYDLSIFFKELDGTYKVIVKVNFSNKIVNRERMERISSKLNNLKEKIEFDKSSDLVKIEPKLKSELLKAIDKSSKKDRVALKYAIKSVFKLRDSDNVIYLGSDIYIKRVPDLHSKFDRRFNSLPDDKLEALEKKLFKDSSSKEFILKRIKEYDVTEFGVDKVVYKNFKHSYITSIEKLIYDILTPILNDDKVLIEGFGNYIIRKNFKEINTEVAKNALLRVLQKSDSALEFIRECIGESEKNEISPIVDRNNKNLDTKIIMQILKNYKASNEKVQNQKLVVKQLLKSIEDSKEKLKLQSRVDSLKKSLLSAQKKLDLLMQEREIGEKKLNTIANAISLNIIKN